MTKKRIKSKVLNKRYILGSIIMLGGIIFMFIPFIPLGYVFLAVGCFLLYPVVPPLKSLLDYLKKRDKHKRIEKAQKKTNEFLGEKKDGSATDTNTSV